MCGHEGVGGRQHCHWDTVSSCCCEEIMRSYPSLCARLFISPCSLLPCDYCCKWSLPWGNPSSKNCDWWNWMWYSIFFLMLEKKEKYVPVFEFEVPQTDEKKAQLLSTFNKWAPKPYLNTHTLAATHKNWPGPLYLLLFSPVAFTALLSFPTFNSSSQILHTCLSLPWLFLLSPRPFQSLCFAKFPGFRPNSRFH